MKTTARILAGLLVLLHLAISAMVIFNVASFMELAGLEAMTIEGNAIVRAFIGGSTLAVGLFLLVDTVIGQNKTALQYFVFFASLVTLSRLLTLVLDGFIPDLILGIIIDFIVLGFGVVSLVLFNKSEAITAEDNVMVPSVG